MTDKVKNPEHAEHEKHGHMAGLQRALGHIVRARPEKVRTPRGQAIAEFADGLISKIEEEIADLTPDPDLAHIPQSAKPAEKPADNASPKPEVDSRRRRGRPAHNTGQSGPAQGSVGAMSTQSAAPIMPKSETVQPAISREAAEDVKKAEPEKENSGDGEGTGEA